MKTISQSLLITCAQHLPNVFLIRCPQISSNLQNTKLCDKQERKEEQSHKLDPYMIQGTQLQHNPRWLRSSSSPLSGKMCGYLTGYNPRNDLGPSLHLLETVPGGEGIGGGGSHALHRCETLFPCQRHTDVWTGNSPGWERGHGFKKRWSGWRVWFLVLGSYLALHISPPFPTSPCLEAVNALRRKNYTNKIHICNIRVYTIQCA